MRLDSGQIEVVDDLMAAILQHKTPEERLRIGFDLWDFAQKMLTSHLTSTHTDCDSERVRREVSRRLSHGAI